MLINEAILFYMPVVDMFYINVHYLIIYYYNFILLENEVNYQDYGTATA